MKTGLRFHRMYASVGWTNDDVAKFLQLSVRTVRLWDSSRVRVSYASCKLLRLQLRHELPGGLCGVLLTNALGIPPVWRNSP